MSPQAAQTATDPLNEPIQDFWQRVYDELRMRIEVPPLPNLTQLQSSRLHQYGLTPIYIPAIGDRFPTSFVRPDWHSHLHPDVPAPRIPLTGVWVAAETIQKPDWDNGKKYPNDLLMKTLGYETRFKTTHDDLTVSILGRIADVLQFPADNVRLPSVEEWNFLGNVFKWLRGRRQLLAFPDLGASRSWEWCRNAVDEYRLTVGYFGRGGLTNVEAEWRGDLSTSCGFRVLVAL